MTKQLDFIFKDSQIIEQYQAIETYETNTGGIAHHNLTHVMNVAQRVEQLLSALNCDETFIQEAKVAAYLHDIGSVEGKENHALKSYEFAKQYINQQKITLTYEPLVLEAIKHHSENVETDNLMALSLILADKLDITKDRLAQAGYAVDGFNQLQYINQVNVQIEDEQLVISFECQEAFDELAYNTFYFSQKVWKTIKSVAKQLNLNPRVLRNGEEWVI